MFEKGELKELLVSKKLIDSFELIISLEISSRSNVGKPFFLMYSIVVLFPLPIGPVTIIIFFQETN